MMGKESEGRVPKTDGRGWGSQSLEQIGLHFRETTRITKASTSTRKVILSETQNSLGIFVAV